MSHHNANTLNLLRGASLWILVALILAWCLVGLYNQIPLLTSLFPGRPERLLQAHIDFLLMSALILGVYASRVDLPWHVSWAMVIGAFTNSSLFLLNALLPMTDPVSAEFAPQSTAFAVYEVYLYSSLALTTYGFGRACILMFRSTLNRLP